MRLEAFLGVLACASAASAQTAPITSRARAAVARGLAYLLEEQRPNGGFCAPSGVKVNDDFLPITASGHEHIGITALAGLSLHTANRHPQAARAARFLVSSAHPSGFIGRSQTRHYSHALAVWFLAAREVRRTDPAVRAVLRRAVRYLVQTQNAEGGWRYLPGPSSDLSVTALCIEALRAARAAKQRVPPHTLRAALTYVRKCAIEPGGTGFGPNALGGGFWYQFHENFPFRPSRSSYALAAAGVAALSGLPAGLRDRQDARRIAAGLQFLRRPQNKPKPGPTYLYGQLNALLVHLRTPPARRATWRDTLVRRLLAAQSADGSWSDPIGPSYGTAVACLLLSATRVLLEPAEPKPDATPPRSPAPRLLPLASRAQRARLLRATGAAKRGDLTVAVEAYQAAYEADREEPRGCLLQVGEGRYVGVVAWVHSGLRALPSAGAAAYRARYEPAAARALRAAQARPDPRSALAKVADRFPLTAAAERALTALAIAEQRAGRPERALAALRRIPRTPARRAQVARLEAQLAPPPPRPLPLKRLRLLVRVRLAVAASQPGGRRARVAPYRPLLRGKRLYLAAPNGLQVHDATTGRALTQPPAGGQRLEARELIGPVAAAGLTIAPVTSLMTGRQFRGLPITVDREVRRLTAYPAGGGQPVWRQARDGRLSRISFASVPAAVAGRLFASGVGPHGDAWVASFEARTGALLWATWVGQGHLAHSYFGFPFRLLCTPVSVVDGRVYHSTSAGTVAALEVTSGRIVWVAHVDPIEFQAARGYYASPRALKWSPAQPRVEGEVLFVAPLDSDRAYAFDRRSGRRRWSSKPGARVVVAVANQRAFLSDGKSTWALSLERGVVGWRRPLRPVGRGCLNAGRLLVPLEKRLAVIDPRSGKELQSFPLPARGDLSIQAGKLLLAAEREVFVYETGP